MERSNALVVCPGPLGVRGPPATAEQRFSRRPGLSRAHRAQGASLARARLSSPPPPQAYSPYGQNAGQDDPRYARRVNTSNSSSEYVRPPQVCPCGGSGARPTPDPPRLSQTALLGLLRHRRVSAVGVPFPSPGIGVGGGVGPHHLPLYRPCGGPLLPPSSPQRLRDAPLEPSDDYERPPRIPPPPRSEGVAPSAPLAGGGRRTVPREL